MYRHLRHRSLLTMLTIMVLSMLTETVQYFTRTGLMELDDVINNTLGGVIGLVAYFFADSIIMGGE